MLLTLNPAHCLRLPRKKLHLTALLYAKKFHFHGYKKGGLAAFQQLGAADLDTKKNKVAD